MEEDDIYPKIKIDDDTYNDVDYNIEIKEKTNFLNTFIKRIKNNVKMLPTSDDRNFKETSISINTMWRYGSMKAFIMQKMEYLFKKVLLSKKKEVKQNNVEVQVISKNNIIKDISIATKKLSIVSPIIPKSR